MPRRSLGIPQTLPPRLGATPQTAAIVAPSMKKALKLGAGNTTPGSKPACRRNSFAMKLRVSRRRAAG